MLEQGLAEQNRIKDVLDETGIKLLSTDNFFIIHSIRADLRFADDRLPQVSHLLLNWTENPLLFLHIGAILGHRAFNPDERIVHFSIGATSKEKAIHAHFISEHTRLTDDPFDAGLIDYHQSYYLTPAEDFSSGLVLAQLKNRTPSIFPPGFKI